MEEANQPIAVWEKRKLSGINKSTRCREFFLFKVKDDMEWTSWIMHVKLRSWLLPFNSAE